MKPRTIHAKLDGAKSGKTMCGLVIFSNDRVRPLTQFNQLRRDVVQNSRTRYCGTCSMYADKRKRQ